MFFVLLFSASMTVNAKPKTMKDGTKFDAEYYAQTYADVKEAIGNDENALYEHYVKYGKAEGRLPYDMGKDVVKTLTDDFDAAYYAKNNPDVVKALGDDENTLYQHYLEHGKKEGRLPNAKSEPAKTETTKTKEDTATKSKSSASVTVPTKNESSGDLVWVPTKGGTKYHNKSSCSNMKNPKHVSLETAIKNGYKPCKKCYK